jgi:hypothetical protein
MSIHSVRSFVTFFKGKAGGTRAMMDMGFDFKDNAWSMRFKFVRSPIGDFPNNHQVRCVDLDADGIDECVNGGYAIKGDGTPSTVSDWRH